NPNRSAAARISRGPETPAGASRCRSSTSAPTTAPESRAILGWNHTSIRPLAIADRSSDAVRIPGPAELGAVGGGGTGTVSSLEISRPLATLPPHVGGGARNHRRDR